MAKQPSIEDLLAQLGSMSYSAPSSYKGYTPVYKGVDRSLPMPMDSWNFTPDTFDSGKKKKKKKESSLKPDFWGMISGTLGQPGGFITDTAHRQIGAFKGLFDDKGSVGTDVLTLLDALNPMSTIRKGAVNGAKKQMENWKDGKFTWGDVPGVGFLNGMDKGWNRGKDIVEDHIGATNKWATVGGGIGIDIALDPLTYLTGGLSMAGKLGKAAEAAEITKHAKSLGMVGKFKNADEFADALVPALQNKYKQYPNLVDKMVEKKFDEITKSIQTARTKAFNANANNWGFSVPFSNKMTASVGSYGTKNPLYRTEAVLGSNYKHAADDILKQYGATGAKAEKVLQTMFGKSDTAALTKGEVDALHEGLEEASRLFAKHQDSLRSMPKADISEVKVLPRNNPYSSMVRPQGSSSAIKMTGPGQKLLTGAVDEATEYDPRWIRDVQTSMGNVNKGKKGVDDFVESQNVLFNGKNKLEHWLDRKNPFDARTLNTGDKFLDSMGDVLSDANSQRVGENAKYIKGLSELQKGINKATKGMSQNEKQQLMNEAIYHLEGKAPVALGSDWVASEKAQQIAEMIKRVTTAVGKDDVAAGNLKALKENYFPHVLNRSADEIQDMIDFDARHGLDGLSSENKFDQARKSFKTIADRDDYVEKLAKQIANSTDEAEKAALQAQLDKVSEMFDVDVVSALTRRVREGVRSRAMKSMQTNLKKYGMMSTEAKKGLVRMDPAEATKLGLKDGTHYIHPEVLKGLHRTDEVFTNENMNKWARHLAAISDIWRPLVTYYKPSHYRNNLIGNTINNMAAGVKMSDYKTAGKLMSKLRKGKLTDAEQRIINEAYKHNVISGGFLFDAQPTFVFNNPTLLENIAKKVGHNPLVDRMRTSGEFMDDFTRLALFVNGMGKYGKVDRAAQQVRKYLFNYNELTNADRAMRVVVPFWNWTKRNIPLQLNLLMEQPKFAMNNERFRNLFNDGEDGADWQKKSGIKITDDHYTSIPSPVNDLEMLTDPGSFLGSINPAMKMFLETQMNKKLYTGKPITYGQDDVAPEDLFPYFMSNLGIGKNVYDAGTGNKSIGESLINLFNPITKIPESERNGGE